jgi:hypothetical protein
MKCAVHSVVVSSDSSLWLIKILWVSRDGVGSGSSITVVPEAGDGPAGKDALF